MKVGKPTIAVITRETRMSGLRARWGTAGQAAFGVKRAASHEVERRRQSKMKKAGFVDDNDLAEFEDAAAQLADHDDYAQEDLVYHAALRELLREIDLGFPIRTVDRNFLPNFDFSRCLAVIVLGQDGLVANTAKYAADLPIIGVNPEPTRFDGTLLPFQSSQVRTVLQRAIKNQAPINEVTLAEVQTNDGQQMLAFNDFFIGCDSHASARYVLESTTATEHQSSSGIIVSTGAGSTGWLSSLFNMASGICRFSGGQDVHPVKLPREGRQLIWAVREPFSSKATGIDNVIGSLNEGEELVIGSEMPANGVIFSDGIEADFLEFNSGTIARFSVAAQRAKLVQG